nr:hypothetical protein [Tanacetum cinerariifolium]
EIHVVTKDFKKVAVQDTVLITDFTYHVVIRFVISICFALRMLMGLVYCIFDCDYYEKKMVQKPVRNHALRGNHPHYARMTHPHPHRHVVPTVVLTRSRLVPLTAARPVTAAVPQTNVQHQRPAKHGVNKAHLLIRRPINHKPLPNNSNFHQKVTTIKANQSTMLGGFTAKGIASIATPSTSVLTLLELPSITSFLAFLELSSTNSVILNGDSPIPTRVIDGVVQPVAPTTAEQRLARKNELKARGTLLMALLDNHQLKLNIHKDAKTLMEAIEKRFGRNKETKKVQKTLLKQQYKNFTGSCFESLDQIHDRLQKLISQLEILGESLSQEDINLKFLRTLKLVSAVASVSAASTKVSVSALPNVDTLSDAIIYSLFASQSNSLQLDNDDLKQIDADDLKKIDLKWWNATTAIGEGTLQESAGHLRTQEGMFHLQAKEEPTNSTLMAFTSSSSSSSDNEVASCSKVCTKAYATLQSHYDKLTNDLRKSQFDVISYKIGLESVEARILFYQQNETVFEEDIKFLKLDVQLRDNALVDHKKKFEKAKQKRDELKLKLDKFQTSSKNISQLLVSQTNDKTRLGYDNQLFNSFVFDCDEMFHSELDVRTFMPPKPDLLFHDALTMNETVPTAFNVKLSTTKIT